MYSKPYSDRWTVNYDNNLRMDKATSANVSFSPSPSSAAPRPQAGRVQCGVPQQSKKRKGLKSFPHHSKKKMQGPPSLCASIGREDSGSRSQAAPPPLLLMVHLRHNAAPENGTFRHFGMLVPELTNESCVIVGVCVACNKPRHLRAATR